MRKPVTQGVPWYNVEYFREPSVPKAGPEKYREHGSTAPRKRAICQEGMEEIIKRRNIGKERGRKPGRIERRKTKMYPRGF